ncbi:diguanylate cyclase response regulator [Geomonas silvestris]|uniref:diguanylate cyclase n=1 Tax=Geomonas silvestris TaxID=2740184 RepID=A0A6V8MLE3_9BACT|nr:diguanylate cyclase [Geomonas silvestris]GFO60818.1 diguanylate cyclase response regulator [Geomonas silvestris]
MERILIVEDDSFFREVFTDLLQEDGYSVDVAASGEEALDLISNREYQLVVTDLVMRDVSGLDILSAVKRLDPAVDVIMVTGHANVETAIFALKNGATDYLVKPINHDEFRHIVAQCMDQRRLLDENLELKGLLHLFQVSQTIANCLELDRIYQLLMDALSKEVGVTRGLGYFSDSGNLVLHEVKGIDPEHASLLGQAVISECELMDDGGALVTLKDFLPDDAEYGAGVTEAMCLYIRHKSTLQGVVVLVNDPGQPLPRPVNRKNLSFLLDQASLALDNAARYNFAKDLLYIDELTGLYNYRYLDVVLERELKRCERYGSNLSVLFLDIDLFKMVNDNFGHLIGSRVLREVGSLLRKGVRDVDAVIRYGGDEYTIVLVETGVEGATVVAERIRRTIEQHTFSRADGLAIKLTVSLGYACAPADCNTKGELLEMADQAMYRGKAGGKNMAFHALPATPPPAG